MHDYIRGELGSEKGDKIWAKAEALIPKLRNNISDFTENQKNTAEKLLPRVAVYLTLKEDDETSEEALSFMDKYMTEVVGTAMHRKYVSMEKIPFFYAIYSRIFCKYTSGSDLWDAKIERNTSSFTVNISKCTWHETCVRNGCPELCEAFCKCDDITYSGLKKISFDRTQTLGTGGCCCDFVFSKIKK